LLKAKQEILTFLFYPLTLVLSPFDMLKLLGIFVFNDQWVFNSDYLAIERLRRLSILQDDIGIKHIPSAVVKVLEKSISDVAHTIHASQVILIWEQVRGHRLIIVVVQPSLFAWSSELRVEAIEPVKIQL
jgi:hypothetical protein